MKSIVRAVAIVASNLCLAFGMYALAWHQDWATLAIFSVGATFFRIIGEGV